MIEEKHSQLNEMKKQIHDLHRSETTINTVEVRAEIKKLEEKAYVLTTEIIKLKQERRQIKMEAEPKQEKTAKQKKKEVYAKYKSLIQARRDAGDALAASVANAKEMREQLKLMSSDEKISEVHGKWCDGTQAEPVADQSGDTCAIEGGVVETTEVDSPQSEPATPEHKPEE